MIARRRMLGCCEGCVSLMPQRFCVVLVVQALLRSPGGTSIGVSNYLFALLLKLVLRGFGVAGVFFGSLGAVCLGVSDDVYSLMLQLV